MFANREGMSELPKGEMEQKKETLFEEREWIFEHGGKFRVTFEKRRDMGGEAILVSGIPVEDDSYSAHKVEVELSPNRNPSFEDAEKARKGDLPFSVAVVNSRHALNNKKLGDAEVFLGRVIDWTREYAQKHKIKEILIYAKEGTMPKEVAIEHGFQPEKQDIPEGMDVSDRPIIYSMEIK